MKKNTYFIAILISCIGLLNACKSDVDLSNIDMSSQINLGIALPIGSMSATIGDFLGDSLIEQIMVDELGIFHFCDTLPLQTREFHSIDLTRYLLHTQEPEQFYIREQYPGAIIPSNQSIKGLKFNMILDVSGINENHEHQRVDSIFVTEANFSSIINVNELDLKWSEIEQIRIVLDKQLFARKKGNEIIIPTQGKNFGNQIPIIIDDFILSLMKDKKKPGETIQQVPIDIVFDLKTSHSIPVNANSYIQYDMTVNFINYDAIWGYFDASQELKDEDEILIDSLWSGWRNFQNLTLKFAEPKLSLLVTHQIAAPLFVHINHIYTKNNTTGETKYATWDGQKSINIPLPNTLDPVHSSFDAQISNSVNFSNAADKGNIDELFNVKPDSVAYSYYIDIDLNKLKSDYNNQGRLVENTSMTAEAAVDLPFIFDKESKINYTIDIDSLDFSDLTIDSIIHSADIIEKINHTELKLILLVRNYIPFALNANILFFDQDGKPIDLKLINNSGIFALSAPNKVDNNGFISEPTDNTVILSIDQTQFDILAQVKRISLDLSLGDNTVKAYLHKNTKLEIKLGLTARVDAVFDFNSFSNN
ncbi:MAG: hypothetical protein IIW05_02355 [Paludibacteraceae bacterium]|nr:hypothetical protein [Paludibacteraceae bacterium]